MRRRIAVRVVALVALVCGPASASGSPTVLAWTAASGPVAGYVVHADVDGKGFQFMGLAPGNAFAVDGQPGESWVLRVAAFDAVGTMGPWSAPSAPVTFPAAGSGGGSSGGGGSGGGAGGSSGGGGFGGISFPLPGPATGQESVWKNRDTGAIGLGIPSDAGFVSVPAAADLRPAAWGDFDGDGRTDLLLHNTASGAVEIWLLNGTTVASKAAPMAGRPAPWVPVAALDGDADGDPDVLWWNRTSGATELWFMDGTVQDETLALARAVTAPRGSFLGAGDFDGDGFDDVAWHEAASGDVTVWSVPGLVSVQWRLGTASGLVPAGVADLDGDGRTNTLWRDPATGAVTGWVDRDGLTEADLFPGAGPEWRLLEASDVDPADRVGLLWRNDSTHGIYRWTLQDLVPTDVAFVVTLPDTSWEKITEFR